MKKVNLLSGVLVATTLLGSQACVSAMGGEKDNLNKPSQGSQYKIAVKEGLLRAVHGDSIDFERYRQFICSDEELENVPERQVDKYPGLPKPDPKDMPNEFLMSTKVATLEEANRIKNEVLKKDPSCDVMIMKSTHYNGESWVDCWQVSVYH